MVQILEPDGRFQVLQEGRQRWRGCGGCVMEGLECLEQIESLWARIKGQTNNVSVTVGTGLYLLPHKNDQDNSKKCHLPQ